MRPGPLRPGNAHRAAVGGLYPQPLFDLAEQGALAMMAVSEAAGTVTAPPSARIVALCSRESSM